MLFDPDPRNLRHLRYCSAGSCRKTSKAASQTRWPSQAQNRNHFRGPEKPTTSNRWISYNFTPLIALAKAGGHARGLELVRRNPFRNGAAGSVGASGFECIAIET